MILNDLVYGRAEFIRPFSFQNKLQKNNAMSKINLIFAPPFGRRGVAQLVARYVRDVEAGSSSLLTPTKRICKASPLFFVIMSNNILNLH